MARALRAPVSALTGVDGGAVGGACAFGVLFTFVYSQHESFRSTMTAPPRISESSSGLVMGSLILGSFWDSFFVWVFSGLCFSFSSHRFHHNTTPRISSTHKTYFLPHVLVMACVSYVYDASPPPTLPLSIYHPPPSPSRREYDVFPPRAHAFPPLRLHTSSDPPTTPPGHASDIHNFTSPHATASSPMRPGPSRRSRASFLPSPHCAPRRSSSPIPDAVEFDACARALAVFLKNLGTCACPVRPSVLTTAPPTGDVCSTLPTQHLTTRRARCACHASTYDLLTYA